MTGPTNPDLRGLLQGAAGAIACFAVCLGGAAAAQTSPPPSPKDFALAAAQSDEYEIQAARDAIAQSRDAGVRGFAQQMIDDHTRTSESLREAATAAGLAPPPMAMSSDHALMLAALQSLRGADFDQAYARQQVLAHTQALVVEGSFAGAGSDPDLRRVARSATPMIQHHLEMAQELRARVGGS